MLRSAVGKKHAKPYSTRELMLESQDGECFYCEKLVFLGHHEEPWNTNAPCRATVDHVISRYNGGSNRRENLVISCYECNAELSRYGL